MNINEMLKGKKVLVTGSGTGIGRGVAMEFAREGADVVFHYSNSADGALAGVEEARALGVRAAAFAADFDDADAAAKIGRQAVEFLGGLDVLVNNAGITLNRPFEAVTVEQFDRLYHVNIRAQFFLTQSVLPALTNAQPGVITNITSIHAFAGMSEHAVYAGTKGAIVAYTRELAMELAPKGIRVNAIAPGAVTVEHHYKAIENYDPESLGSCIPAGFIGNPHDIGRVAVFLASDDARYILGHTLVVDGGTTSRLSFEKMGVQSPSSHRFGKGYVPGV